MSESLESRYASSPLFGSNAPYVERFYEAYLADPDSVPAIWRSYFAELTRNADHQEVPHGPIREALRDQARQNGQTGAARRVGGTATPLASEKQAAVSRLIQAYSLRGHQIADLDPLGLQTRHVPSVLKLDFLGLDERDLDTEFHPGGLAGTTAERMKLRDILALLKRIYCGTVGAEFAHVSRARERLWLRERFELGRIANPFDHADKITILTLLTRAEGLERYLHTRYVGQKRFSLEGGGTLIPMLGDLIQQSGGIGVQEMVIGMAHRGRINVLVNVLGKLPADLFSEFEGNYDPASLKGSGDVKYHKGFSADIKTPGGRVHIALAFNPSHLEIVNPVVEGSVRARQERCGDRRGDRVLPVLIHGDAAFAGQGVVTETFQMSQARGFSTGGTVHIVINNQIGFTMSDPRDARSTPYCSDVAKMIEAPVFHVNADDPDAVVFVTRLALDYRQAFHKDVVIDLMCYRRHGHNEADEPAATQPVMYRAIREHATTRKLYADQLVADGAMTQAGVDQLIDDYRDALDAGRQVPAAALGLVGNEYTVDWSRHLDSDWAAETKTAISRQRIDKMWASLRQCPEDFELHPRVERIVQGRNAMATGELPMDWGFAETLAYASLLQDGFRVRLTGQDSGRGTFFHRHAALHNQSDNAIYVPLEHLVEADHVFKVTDSLLSEEAVLGFEYGYATTDPNVLVIWEAQFGDFCNGAQVVIDQFISSGEAKWGRLCGLTLFLPHGYEGQGPEHSSARLERFLQLCAEHNLQVCLPSTPAQMFHMLRRQMMRSFRKPLIVMTPKSLLRHKLSVSSLSDLSDGGFLNVYREQDMLDDERVKRIVFCSGKVYYDLLEARREHSIDEVALVRIEQLYPFPAEAYRKQIERYTAATEIVWCQEEPQNQGAWYQLRHKLQRPMTAKQKLFYAGRAGAAAPAAGIFAVHMRQQQALVGAALGMGSD